jgi:hypothetical protein
MENAFSFSFQWAFLKLLKEEVQSKVTQWAAVVPASYRALSHPREGRTKWL